LAVTLQTSRRDSLPQAALLAGRYHISRVIHRGGMSIVYLAEDTLLQNRQVALKELRPAEGASPEDLREAEAWFARESALLSVLRHPLIPTFFSVFREEGRSYIAQEFVPGENLDEVIRTSGPRSDEAAINLGLQLCGLLSYLHNLAEPVIFRDLKPANILLRNTMGMPGPDVAVVDFGIARPFQAGAVGTIIGTPGYAPPEQYQGLASPRSDIYALGATLHRALTGYDPEAGTPFTFPPIRTLNPAVSPELAAAVERAVALNPADRFASADEFALALQTLARVRYYAYVPPQRGHPVVSSHRTVGLVAALMLLPVLLSPIIRAATLYPSTPDNGQSPWGGSSGYWNPGGYSGSSDFVQPNGSGNNSVNVNACDLQTGSSSNFALICPQDGSYGQGWVEISGSDLNDPNQWSGGAQSSTSAGH
jgi:serine/threonine protein kinase